MPIPKDSTSFTDTMADILRLPDETLAMSYVYLNRYERFQSSSISSDPLDSPDLPKTLALACLSLASKSTESPRRMREILFPAHRLLHSHNGASSDPINQPLVVPSTMYDSLRATLVQAELTLLRILGFELRIPLPLDFLPRYLERAMEDVAGASENYDAWGNEEKEEYGVVKDVMDTSIGRSCRSKAISACKNYQLANLFPARAVALGCLNVTMEERGLRTANARKEWVDDIGSRKVDNEDFEEVVEILKRV
ncbi:hypothetical protein IMSHALPRED_000320 [Imshaugia aleurites]|uniref:Uncharacterized protein n=1 Tax=Imshaugia aleurites TaxID=172621 RepID=A0A8H3I2E5_9LECA|nr:hypothetical protein IMSHALPRED_000320 [Imshaugia aleurites]